MTRFSRLMGLVACALLFAACAGPGARTHVATFHNWTGAQPLTYELVRTPAQVESLEHAAYEAMLEERLGRAGFSRAQPARYRVGFDYRVVQNETIGARPRPSVSLGGIFGTGVGVGVGVGVPIGGASTPASFQFTRTVRLMIDDVQGGTPTRVWEATATRIGETPTLKDDLPAMLDEAFRDFPGTSGTPRGG